MEYELKTGVVWNSDLDRQSDTAMQFIREEIYPRLACNASETELVQPIYDSNKRPLSWTLELDTCVITVTREYIDNTWGLKADHITVNTK